MKVHKPIKLFVPSTIQKVIDEKAIKDLEKYCYLIHYILILPVKDKRNENFVYLNKEKLRLLLGCNLNTYIKFLIKCELIECDKNYIPGEKTFYYRINPKHKFDLNFYELKPHTRLFKNITKQLKNEKAHFNQLDPHLYKMAKKFMNLQFDYEGALNWIKINVKDEQKQLSYVIAINLLSDEKFRYFKRNRTNNRLDTNITNLKKELRTFIKGEYVVIDLKNSQPFFLSFLFENLTKILKYFTLKRIEINQNNIEEILNNKHTTYCYNSILLNLIENFGLQSIKSILLIHKKRDFSFYVNLSLFKKWVTNGVFYDEFIKEFNKDSEEKLTREDIKKIMFEVLFSRNVLYEKYKQFKPFEKEKKIFASVFPVIYEIIECLKEKDNAKLAIYLQKLESRIFIDCIAKELVENNIIPLTVHDSVIVPIEKEEQTISIMQSVFKREIGTIPTFHIEKLKKSGLCK